MRMAMSSPASADPIRAPPAASAPRTGSQWTPTATSTSPRSPGPWPARRDSSHPIATPSRSSCYLAEAPPDRNPLYATGSPRPPAGTPSRGGPRSGGAAATLSRALLLYLLGERVVVEGGRVDLVGDLEVRAEGRVVLAVLDIHFEDVLDAFLVDEAVGREVLLARFERLHVELDVVPGHALG